MSVYKEEFEFKLTKPIKCQSTISGENKFIDCYNLILKAPNLRSHYRIGNILQALFTPAMMKAQISMIEFAKGIEGEINQEKVDKKENKENADEEDLETNKVIINFSIMELGEKINTFYDNFEKLLISEGICCLDNNIPFTKVELNALNYKDFKKLVSEYTAHFFIASWMNLLSGN